MNFSDIDYSSLNYIDVALLAIVALSVLFATIRGFILSSVSLVGWIASLVITYKYAPFCKKMLIAHCNSEVVAMIISYSSLMIVTLIMFAILNSLFATLTSGMRGGFFDRLLGALFGLLRGALIASFIFMCVSTGFKFLSADSDDSDDALPEPIKKAQSYKLLKMGNAVLLNVMPSNINERFESISDTLTENFNDQFVEGMVRKMYQDLSDTDIDEIESALKENGWMSDKEKSAAFVLKNYKSKALSSSINGNEVKKLERMLNKSEN